MGSRSQVNGPSPVALTVLIVMVTVLPLVTWVTWFAARAFSVFSPISMLPPAVRPHSLTTLATTSAWEMKFESAGFLGSTITGQLGAHIIIGDES